MTALITSLIVGPNNHELVRDKIATIIVEESAAQMVLALASETAPLVTYEDGRTSDYTATAALSVLQYGAYTVTAGTLSSGIGTWTCVAPDGTSEQDTTSAADDDLVFTALGLTLVVTAGSVEFVTGDVIVATAYNREEYRLRVFTERSNPWEVWDSKPENTHADAAPIVALALRQSSTDRGKSDAIKKQHWDANYEIDCYGYGKSTETAGGHEPGDGLSSLEALRAVALVNRILMFSGYMYLGMRGTVGSRMSESVERFPPDLESVPPNITAFRFVLRVGLIELSPQFTALGTVDTINTDYIRTSDGEIVAQSSVVHA